MSYEVRLRRTVREGLDALPERDYDRVAEATGYRNTQNFRLRILLTSHKEVKPIATEEPSHLLR